MAGHIITENGIDDEDLVRRQGEPSTPEDEAELVLRASWLEDRIDGLLEPSRGIMRSAFGLDGPARSRRRIASDLGVSKQRINQIVEKTIADLQTAWRRSQRDAALLLEFGDAEIKLPPEPSSEPEQTSTRKDVPARTRKSHWPHVRNLGGMIAVCNITVKRIGEDLYLIDDHIKVSADEVAVILLEKIGDNQDEAAKKHRAILRHDTDIADALRHRAMGPCWPTPPAQRFVLPMTTK